MTSRRKRIQSKMIKPKRDHEAPQDPVVQTPQHPECLQADSSLQISTPGEVILGKTLWNARTCKHVHSHSLAICFLPLASLHWPQGWDWG